MNVKVYVTVASILLTFVGAVKSKDGTFSNDVADDDVETQLKKQSKELQEFQEQLKQLQREVKQKDEMIENLHHQLEQHKRSDDPTPLEAVVNQMSQRMLEVTADLQTLQTKNQALTEAIGTTYVRWGKSTCPSSSLLVYSGIIGGAYYTHQGAPTNALCLPMNPVYSSNDHTSIGQQWPGYAHIYGSEYEVSPESNHNLDGVCAVCRSPRSSVVMVPATTVCQSGWTAEYTGNLMAGHSDTGQTSGHAGSEYICVDSALEGRPGSNDNHDGLLLYFTGGACGSLPCPPYVEGRIITCVVCSR